MTVTSTNGGMMIGFEPEPQNAIKLEEETKKSANLRKMKWGEPGAPWIKTNTTSVPPTNRCSICIYSKIISFWLFFYKIIDITLVTIITNVIKFARFSKLPPRNILQRFLYNWCDSLLLHHISSLVDDALFSFCFKVHIREVVKFITFLLTKEVFLFPIS